MDSSLLVSKTVNIIFIFLLVTIIVNISVILFIFINYVLKLSKLLRFKYSSEYNNDDIDNILNYLMDKCNKLHNIFKIDVKLLLFICTGILVVAISLSIYKNYCIISVIPTDRDLEICQTIINELYVNNINELDTIWSNNIEKLIVKEERYKLNPSTMENLLYRHSKLTSKDTEIIYKKTMIDDKSIILVYDIISPAEYQQRTSYFEFNEEGLVKVYHEYNELDYCIDYMIGDS